MTDQRQPPTPIQLKPTLSPEAQDRALETLTKQAQASAGKQVEAAKAHQTLASDLFGVGQRDFRLPAGAVINDVVYDQVYVKEMTGVEEDMLANTDLEVVERIERVCAACVTKIVSRENPSMVIADPEMIRKIISGTLPSDQGLPFTSADRIALMLFIRRVTVGDLYKYEATCPHAGCGYKNQNKALELDTVEISYNPHPKKRRVKVKLPKSGIEAVVKVLDGVGERAAALLKPDKEDYTSLALMVRIDSLGGHKLEQLPYADRVELIRQMPRRDREYLRSVFQKIEGAVDTDVELTCKKCQREISFPLDLGQIFFSKHEDSISDSELEWL